MRAARLVVLVAGAALAAAASPASPAAAQELSRDTAALRREIMRRAGPGATEADILRRIQQSGMSTDEIRQRMRDLGYDPALLDEYLASGGVGASPDLLAALGQLGIHEGPMPPDSLYGDSAVAAAEETRIFGKSLFARTTSAFQPTLTGPVPSDYILGPGDELWLVLTGDVQASFPLPVSREGSIIIPEVGRIPVAGLTLGQLEDRLFAELGEVYSGVRRGPEATTRFQLTLGRLRTNHVFVVGEVERPSGYQVSPLARVFNALYWAGGPNENGSFRRILVRRDGHVVGEVDLYPYLLSGEVTDDVRLEQGDMVFVPLAGRRVTIEGAARREGIFELRPGEGLRDALAFAGGVRPDAVLERVQIDRILPPGLREPGKERVLVDVDVERLLMEEGTIPLEDGDIIRLFEVGLERRNRVIVTGAVRHPGQYQWQPGMTLEALIGEARGLQEGAYTPRAHIFRLQPDNTRRLVTASLAGDGAAVPLADRDSVVVLREDSLRLDRTVTITGMVKNPGPYRLAEDMTVRDLVLMAGGFREGANTRQAEVARSVDPDSRTAETAEVVTVPLLDDNPAGTNGVPVWLPGADEFRLERGDRVYVRRAPGYEDVRAVALTGEVMMPGAYELDSRQTRISDVIRRAGGLTPEAYPRGFAIIRDGRPIAGDLTRALREPGAPGDILLEAGDSLHVPVYDGTVAISGAVLFEAKVLYEEGRSLADYIERAGGYTDAADPDRVVVTYPNGERKVVEDFLLFRRNPVVEPGSTILVPELPPSERQGVNWDQVIGRTSAVIGTLATLLVLINQVNK